MIDINLYPYNLWFLYFAIAITIIALFLLFSKLFSLLSKIKSKNPEILKLNENLKTLNAKYTTVNDDFKKRIEIIKKITPYIVLTYFFYRNYKDSNEEGIKRINTSVKNAISRKPIRNENKMIKAMRTL